MWSFCKFILFSAVAIAVGIFIGTVPLDGLTIAERFEQPTAARARPSEPRAAQQAPSAQQRVAAAVRAQPSAPMTAGAANSPEVLTSTDKSALDQLIASRASRH